jgi:hypothetical protein
MCEIVKNTDELNDSPRAHFWSANYLHTAPL